MQVSQGRAVPQQEFPLERKRRIIQGGDDGREQLFILHLTNKSPRAISQAPTRIGEVGVVPFLSDEKL